ncbi:MAG: Gfo/Idh/MocA family oxidoreductase [Planctomycetales bacterium]
MSDSPAARPSRREFLSTSTKAAVGAGLLGGLALPARAYAGQDSTIKVGLIGCGGRGSGAAVQALSTDGPVKLVAVGDAFEDQARGALRRIQGALGERAAERVQVIDEHVFSGFDAYQGVIASGVDLVILATPPGFRPIHFEAAVRAGKHVFAEKPVATDAPGVRKFLEAVKVAKEKNLKVGVGLQRHHQNSYLETMKQLHDGAIGEIVALRCYWNGSGVWEPRRTREQTKTEMEYQMRNWYYYNWLCGDHIVEQHIHNLDVGNWLKGSYPVTAYGMGGREVRTDARYGDIFDHHAVEYVYADGTRMYSQCRHIRGCWNSVSEHAQGTKGTADISGSAIYSPPSQGGGRGRVAGTNAAGGPSPNPSLEGRGVAWRYRGPKNDPYQTEHDDLFAAIRSDRPYNEGENGALSTMTAIFGRMATYSGKEVQLADALASELSIMPQSYDWNALPPVLPNAAGEYPVAVPGVTRVL